MFVVVRFCRRVSGREERIVCDRVLTFGEEPSPSIPDRIRRVDFLPLEFSEAAAFRRADKLLFRNGLIYVGDFGSRKIVAYDMAGRVSFVIHRARPGSRRISGDEEFHGRRPECLCRR